MLMPCLDGRWGAIMRRRAALLGFGLVVTVLAAGVAIASSSAQYSLPLGGWSAGGGTSASTSWQVQGAVSHGPVGMATSAGYHLRFGPWAVPGSAGVATPPAERPGAYLPLVRRGN